MSLIFHAFECGITATGVFQDMKLWGHRVVLAGSVERLGQDRAFPWLFHQSSKSLVVAARRGHIFATFCLGRPARLTRRCRLVVLGQPLARGVSVAKVLLVLSAPRRPAVKPGMTPVERAAPRVRRARSARRLDNQSNATPRSWCGSRRRAHVTVALANHHPLLSRCYNRYRQGVGLVWGNLKRGPTASVIGVGLEVSLKGKGSGK